MKKKVLNPRINVAVNRLDYESFKETINNNYDLSAYDGLNFLIRLINKTGQNPKDLYEGESNGVDSIINRMEINLKNDFSKLIDEQSKLRQQLFSFLKVNETELIIPMFLEGKKMSGLINIIIELFYQLAEKGMEREGLRKLVEGLTGKMEKDLANEIIKSDGVLKSKILNK